MESFKSDLRSCCLINKNGINIERLNDVFFDLTQTKICYDSKFNSLEEFLRSIPDTVELVETSYGTIVFGVSTSNQAHLLKLIRGQKNEPSNLIYRKPNNKSLAESGKEIVRSQFNNSDHRAYYGGKENRPRNKDTGKSYSNHSKGRRSTEKDARLPPKFNALKSNSVFELTSDINTTDYDCDYKADLDRFIEEHKLEQATYSSPEPMVIVKDGETMKAYLSNLHVGDQCWITFPTYFDCPERAQNYLAKKALDQLKCMIKLQEDSIEQHTNENMINNLVKLFDQDVNSFLSTYLEKKYFDTYGKRLNHNWLDIVKNYSMLFSVDSFKSRDKIYWTISLINSQSSQIQQQNDSMDINSIDCSMEYGERTETAKSEFIEKSTTLDSIQEQPEFSIDKPVDNWKVIVLNTESDWREEIVLWFNQRWLRLVENTQELNRILSKIHVYYVDEQKGLPPSEPITINKVYAVLKDKSVYRAKVLELIGEEVKCLFLDNGSYENVSKDKFFELEDEFASSLPFKASEVELENVNIHNEETRQLMVKYVDFKMKENNNSLCWIAKPTSFNSDPISVRLYDRSSGNDVLINQLMANFINNSLKDKKSI